MKRRVTNFVRWGSIALAGSAPVALASVYAQPEDGRTRHMTCLEAEAARRADPLCRICRCASVERWKKESVVSDSSPDLDDGLPDHIEGGTDDDEVQVALLLDTSTSVLFGGPKETPDGGDLARWLIKEDILRKRAEELMERMQKVFRLRDAGVFDIPQCLPEPVCRGFDAQICDPLSAEGGFKNRFSPIPEVLTCAARSGVRTKRYLIIAVTDAAVQANDDRLVRATIDALLQNVKNLAIVLLLVPGEQPPDARSPCPASAGPRCLALDGGQYEVPRVAPADIRALFPSLGGPPRGPSPSTTTKLVSDGCDLVREVPVDGLASAVLVGNDRAWDCSGTPIGERAVLTAAHCLPATRVFAGESAAEAVAEIPVEAIVRHPEAQVDMALLRTARPHGAPLAPRRGARDVDPPSTVLRHVGFGATGVDGRGRFGRKKITDFLAAGWGCDGNRPRETGCVEGREMVIAATLGADTCHGDSGGPVYELLGDGETCGYRLVGVTSRRVANAATECGSGGIYTRVDAHDAWIQGVLDRWKSEGL
jgi:hypothetical protein